MPAQYPANPAGGAQTSGDQTQPAQTPGGQPDYTKAWEEYYKKMGETAKEQYNFTCYNNQYSIYYLIISMVHCFK